MDFKLNRETISVSEDIYEGIQEQGIELDYILPDYCPDVFRLVKCEVIPTITDYNINGDKLNYELRCDMKILYCSDSSSVLQCINQKQTFSRSLDIGKFCENLCVKINPKVDYVNYRAVNKRRLDLRGAISIKIKITGEKKQDVICDAFGMNMKMKKLPVQFAEKRIASMKSIQLNEDIEINASQPSIINVVRCCCNSIRCDKKVISGKVMAKGEALIKLLYSCENDGEGAIEPLEFAVPFSQIMDAEGIDDSSNINISATPVYCDIVPVADKDGENRLLRCEMEIRLECETVKTISVMLGADAYSTTYPSTLSLIDIKVEQVPIVITEEIHNSAKLCEGENMPVNIYDLWCSSKNINTRFIPDEGCVIVSGMLTYTIVGKDSAGLIVMTEKEEAFEESFEIKDLSSGSIATSNVNVKNVSYNISAENVLQAKADISVELSIFSSSSVKAIADITVDDSAKKPNDDYALKLYYGSDNEDIWDIAKRYCTSVDAIMEENDLYSDKLEHGGMLLIPIVL